MSKFVYGTIIVTIQQAVKNFHRQRREYGTVTSKITNRYGGGRIMSDMVTIKCIEGSLKGQTWTFHCVDTAIIGRMAKKTEPL